MCSHDDGRSVIKSNKCSALWSWYCCGFSITAILICWPKEFTRAAKGQEMGNRCDLFRGKNSKVTWERVQIWGGVNNWALIAVYFTYPQTSKTKTNEQLFQWTAFFSLYWLYYRCFYSCFFNSMNLFSVLGNTFLCYNFEKLQFFISDLWMLNDPCISGINPQFCYITLFTCLDSILMYVYSNWLNSSFQLFYICKFVWIFAIVNSDAANVHVAESFSPVFAQIL